MSSIFFGHKIRPSRLAADTFQGDMREKFENSPRSSLGTIKRNRNATENKSFPTKGKNATLDTQSKYRINKNQTELAKGRKSNIIAPPKILGRFQHGSPGQYVNRPFATDNKISVLLSSYEI